MKNKKFKLIVGHQINYSVSTIADVTKTLRDDDQK